MYDCHEKIVFELNHLIRKPPSLCTGCGECEDVCPQHLRVTDILKETKEMFEDHAKQDWRQYL
jgi:hypothetical protein